jgi:hypothetical protein
MPKFYAPGDLIEGEKILAFGRKIVPSGLPIRDSITRKLRYKIQIRKSGGARIEKPYTPPIAIFNAVSHLNLDDELWGNQLDGSSLKRFVPDDKNVGGCRTSRHPGQSWMMEEACIVCIVKDLNLQGVQLSGT